MRNVVSESLGHLLAVDQDCSRLVVGNGFSGRDDSARRSDQDPAMVQSKV